MIFAAGPFPPPLHGMAAVNQQVGALLARRVPVTIASIGPGSSRGWRGHITKIGSIATAFVGLIAARLKGCRTLYMSVDDGLGGTWNALLALAARAMRMQIFIHHHSFAYVDRSTRLMTAITRAATSDATHIMLCDRMGAIMQRRYPAIGRSIIVPNTTEVPSALVRRRSNGSLAVGMLSNLMPEKGVGEYLETLRRCVAGGQAIRGILAGPAVGATRGMIESAISDGVALEWRGPVSGEEKERYFADIDVFLFLTRYKAEAYPLVIVEALASGLPVITTNKGCLPAFAGLHACDVLDIESDYVAAATALLIDLASDPALLATRQRAARREGAALVAENRSRLEALIDRILAAAGSIQSGSDGDDAR